MRNHSQRLFFISSFPRRRESSQGNCAYTGFIAIHTGLACSLDSRLRGNDGD